MSTPYAGNPANFPATIPILSDGDTPAAATWAVPYEGLADRTAWLEARRTVFIDRVAYDVESGTWAVFDGTNFAGFVGGHIDVPDAKAGDIVLVDFAFTSLLGTAATIGHVRLAAVDAWTGVETPGQITGARCQFENYLVSGTPVTIPQASHISASWLVQDAGTTRIAIQGKVAGPAGAGNAVALYSAASLRVVNMRGLG